MAIDITWYGHATWLIQTGDHKILLDPFFNDNPSSPVQAEAVEADTILISHGHFDHIADAASVAQRTGAEVLANYEIAEWLSANQDVPQVTGMNIGGQVQRPWGSVKMVPAIHSSQLPDGSYGGEPAGFVLNLADTKIYFACDTALFGDMQIIGNMGIQVAILPIGDLFTMGPADSIQAAKWVHADQVLPTHYNTWPAIEQNAETWAQSIRAGTESQPILLKPGQTHAV